MAEKRELLLRLLGKDDASQVTGKVGRAFGDLADKVGKTSKATDKLSTSTTVATGKAAALGGEATDTARDIAKLTREIELAERELDGLGRAFARTDVAAERMDISKAMRKQQAEINRMTKVKGRMSLKITPELDTAAVAGFGKQVSGMLASVSASAGPAAIAGLALAAPMIGATIAGAVIGGAGIGGVAGGVILAAKDPRVKAAIAGLSKEAGDELKDMAKPMIPAVMSAIDHIRGGFQSLRPELRSIFADSAGLTGPLVAGAIRGVQGVVRGVRDAVAEAGPVIDALAKGVGDIGEQIGSTLTDLSSHADEGASAIERITDGTVALIDVVGKVVGALSTVYGWYEKIDGKVESITGMTIWETMAGPIGIVTDLWGKLNNKGEKTAQVMPSVAAATKATAAEVKAQAQAVADLKDKYDSLTEANISAFDAQIATKAQIKETTEAIKKNGEATSNNTTKGRANNEALSALAKRFNTLQDATERAGGSTNRVNGIYNTNRARLIAQAEAAGYSAGKARQLADDLLKIPKSRVSTIKANTGPASANVAEYKAGLAGIPRNITTTVNVMGVSAYAEYYSGGRYKAPKRERGGPVKAGQAYIVGEKRAELFVPDTNGTILPDVGQGKTGRVAGTAGMSGGTMVTVNVYAHPSNNPAEVGRELNRALTAYYNNGGKRA